MTDTLEEYVTMFVIQVTMKETIYYEDYAKGKDPGFKQ